MVLSFASRDFEARASRRNLGESQGRCRCRRIKIFNLTGAGFPCMFALFEPKGSNNSPQEAPMTAVTKRKNRSVSGLLLYLNREFRLLQHFSRRPPSFQF